MAHWRLAAPADDEAIVTMFVAFNREDPGQAPVPPEHMRRTLAALRERPERGRAVVLDVDGRPRGYALLIPFWSNELGGELCALDELYVADDVRGQGHATALIKVLDAGTSLWPGPSVGVVLEVCPENTKAVALYRRLGFAGGNVGLRLPRAR